MAKKDKEYCAYIDEYGNSGDAVKFNAAHPFGDQPIFCLSAVILEKNKDDILKYAESLFPGRTELKSSSLYPKFTPNVLKIFEKLTKNRFKTRIELVDKKYQLCCFLVNQFVWPPQECKKLDDARFLVRAFAEKLYDEAPNNLWEKYYELAQNCSKETVAIFFDFLKGLFSDFKNDVFYYPLIEAIDETKDSFENELHTFKRPENLFQADFSASGNNLYLVPNLQSFANLYLRLCSLNCNLTITHDKQSQFSPIMAMHKKFLVENKDILPSMEKVGYKPNQIRDLPLLFEDSKNVKQIQIADIISGFIGRIHQKNVQSENLTKEEKEIVNIVKYKMQLNYVCPSKHGFIWGMA